MFYSKAVDCEYFDDVGEALKQANQLYTDSIAAIEEAFEEFAKHIFKTSDFDSFEKKVAERESLFIKVAEMALKGRYPIIMVRPYFQRLNYQELLNSDLNRMDFNTVRLNRIAGSFHCTSITRPIDKPFRDILFSELSFIQYGIEPIGFECPQSILDNRSGFNRGARPIYVGLSNEPIPLSFAINGNTINSRAQEALELALNQHKNPDVTYDFKSRMLARFKRGLLESFARPNLSKIDDTRVDGIRDGEQFDAGIYRLYPSIFDDGLKRFLQTADFVNRDQPTSVGPLVNGLKSGVKEQLNEHFIRALESDTKLLKGVYEKDLKPLSFYSALRTDYSIARLEHYCHTDLEHFQPNVLFTNYKLYVRAFLATYLIKAYCQQGRLIVSGTSLSQGKPQYGKEIDKLSAKNYIVNGLINLRNIMLREPISDVPDLLKNLGDSSEVVTEKLDLILKSGNEDKIASYLIKAMVDLAEEDNNPFRPLFNSDAQMPAYHFEQTKHDPVNSMPSITLINIGVGPANARTITDNLAVIRPRVWLMLGHCAGVRVTQSIGDYVLPAGYLRRDNALQKEVPLNIDLPYVEVVNSALEQAVETILTGKSVESFGIEASQYEKEEDYSLRVRRKFRAGVCMSVQNRHWELYPFKEMLHELEMGRVVAVEMESATLAANGYRHRVPFGALLSVSDNPLMGELKMRDSSTEFYEKSTGEHFRIGLEALRVLNQPHVLTRLRATRRLNGLDDPLIR